MQIQEFSYIFILDIIIYETTVDNYLLMDIWKSSKWFVKFLYLYIWWNNCL